MQEADNLTRRRVGTLEPQQKGQSFQFVQRLGSEKKVRAWVRVSVFVRVWKRDRERENEKRGLSDSPLGKYGRQWSITLVVNFYV